MNWEAIITLIFSEVLKCIKAGRSDEEIAEGIRQPGPAQRIRLERQVRLSRNMNRIAWRQQKSAIMAPIYQDAASLTDEEVRDLIDEAREDD